MSPSRQGGQVASHLFDMQRPWPLRRILYAGTPSSGRRTSLADLTGQFDVGPECTFQWESDGRGRRVSVRIFEGPSERADQATAGPGLQLSQQERAFLTRVDAVVFVVDPRRCCLGANASALQRLTQALGDAGRSPEHVPLVFQLNKLDLPLDEAGATYFAQNTGWRDETQLLVRAPLSLLRRDYQWPRCEYVETIASAGIGVRETLERALALVDGATS